MTQNISALKDELTAQINAANDLQKLEEARLAALGKKGRITDLMKSLGGMAPEERKNFGAAVNELKDEVAALIEKQEAGLKKQAMAEKLAAETIDVTLPIRNERKGTIHPISQTQEELLSIFASMGFELDEGPDIEDDFHNFTALNFPLGHPAREMHDTFYLPSDPDEKGEEQKKLLRTHTSTVQIRHMLGKKPPFKMVCMGRVYRSDYDMTHTPVFHQMEGLVIDKNIHMGHLKGCLMDFLRAYFEIDDLPVQFRPSFFPFTEPSAEVDIGCSRKNGELKIGAGDGWLEILGCGMVHPNVLKNCGVDPNEYQGFAFGMGVERLAMLKYGIPDLRSMFESDVRWLDHYGFDPLSRPNRATSSK
jgi:phenylalanyl-tRNA synthetase alpha chain